MSGASSKRRAVFLRVALPGGDFIRLWLGFADVDVPTNDLDVGEERYGGFGAIVGIPVLEDAINGKSSRIDITLSPVPAYIAAIADLEEGDVKGALVNIGAAKLDDDWQIDGGVIWLADFVADVLRTVMSADSDGGQNFSITLSMGSANAGRSRAEYANWTDAQHQRAHPGDKFFDHVPPPEATKRWPGG